MIDVTERVTVERMKPLNRRVLIRWAQRPEVTKGGIVLPEIARGISQTGVIVKASDDVRDVKEGDVVIFSTYAATPCVSGPIEEADGLVFVRENDVMAVVEP